MIIKKNFSPVKVLSYVRLELFTVLVSASCALSFYYFGIKNLFLPFSIATILGSALAIFIAFRNNAAYSRWWEARSQWSSILNSSRILARIVITFTDSHKNNKESSKEKSEGFKRELVMLVIAWSIVLKMNLRGSSNWEAIRGHMSNDVFEKFTQAHNKLNYIMFVIGTKVHEAMNNGVLAGFDGFQIENQLLALQNSQGTLERIKSTPLLRQYHYFTRVFLFVFIVLLPFALMLDFAKNGYEYMIVPISIVIALVFSIIAKVGEVNEDPFENRITDVPMDYVTNTIERDLLEMIGVKELPPKLKPQDGYLQ